MKVFLDTNVALDFLLKRGDFFVPARNVIALCLNRGYQLYISSVSFANISYLARKGSDGMSVNELLTSLRSMLSVSTCDQNTVDQSIRINPKDFEDAMQYFSAETEQCDYIVSRNVKDFPVLDIPVLTPQEFIDNIYNR